MSTIAKNPEVFTISLWGYLCFVAFAAPCVLIVNFLKGHSLNLESIILFSCFFAAIYIATPRLTLDEEGIRATVLHLPWMRLKRWRDVIRVGVSKSGNWLWVEDRQEDTVWVFLGFLNIEGKDLLERIADRHRTHLNQFCDKCDYNLRDNTTGKCPECGADVPHREAQLVIVNEEELK